MGGNLVDQRYVKKIDSLTQKNYLAIWEVFNTAYPRKAMWFLGSKNT
jgi:hypothetical protein